MQIVVFGATDLTLSVLNFLYANSYKIAAIVTVPQTFKISYMPGGVTNSRFVNLDEWAQTKNIPVISYEDSEQTHEALSEFKSDKLFAIVVGWYHMLPKKLRSVFSLGCSGFHASLLPKLRGGAPLNWAILLNHQESGVSFFELSDGVDDGVLFDQIKFPINQDDAIKHLISKSELAIIEILQRKLPEIASGKPSTYPQQGTPSYGGQRTPEDSLIDWNLSAQQILRLIRASSKPYSGAYTFLDGEKITIWEAAIAEHEIHAIPGQIFIIIGHIYIKCADLCLKLTDFSNNEFLYKSNNKRFNKCYQN